MTGRSVPEWVATHPDQAIPPRVKLRIFERCGGVCALTGVKLRPGHFDYDHIVPLILGGAHAESNIQCVSREAHREKTKDDVARKAKADRIRKKHLGLWPPPTQRMPSRPFPKRQPDDRQAKKTMEPT